MFHQWVMSDGYQWEDDALVEPQDAGKAHSLDVGECLFRQFAQVTPDKEGILGFANTYGYLFTRSMLDDPLGYRETLGDWQQAIDQLRRVIDIWQWAQKRNARALRKFIKWESDSTVVYKYEGALLVNPIATIHKGSSGFVEGGVIEPAKAWVVSQINSQFQGTAAGNLAIQIRPRLIAPSESDLAESAELDYAPSTLISELWLQLARTVASGREQRACTECGDWFLVEPKKERRQKQKFCSSACRSRAYRRRAKK